MKKKEWQTCPQQQIHIQVLNPGHQWMSQSIDGWKIKVFAEAITQRLSDKSRAGHQWSHTQPPAIVYWGPLARVAVSAHALKQRYSNLAEYQIYLAQTLLPSISQNKTITKRNKRPGFSYKLRLTSAEELQVAHLFPDLQLEDLLKDLLPQGLLDDSHPLQFLAVQPQQCPPWWKKDEHSISVKRFSVKTTVTDPRAQTLKNIA